MMSFYKTFRCILFMFTLCYFCWHAHAKAFIFEAEDSHAVGLLNINNPEEGAVYRSEASGRKAVHLIQGQYLEYTFCVRKETKVQVSNIRFSMTVRMTNMLLRLTEMSLENLRQEHKPEVELHGMIIIPVVRWEIRWILGLVATRSS